MKKVVIKIYDSAAQKRVFNSFFKDSSLEMKKFVENFFVKRNKKYVYNPNGKDIELCLEKLEFLTDDKKFYLLTFLMDNISQDNRGLISKLFSKEEKLLKMFKEIHSLPFPKPNERIVNFDNYPEFTFDFNSYGRDQLNKKRLNKYGFKVGDIVRCGYLKDKLEITKMDDSEFEKRLDWACTGLLIFKDTKTGDELKFGIEALADCKKVRKSWNIKSQKNS